MREAQFFKALSEPLRLRIMALLLEYNEVCVCDLVSVLNVPQGTVSRHLSYLKKSNLVESVTKGTWRYYRLCPKLDKRHRDVLTLTQNLLSDEADVTRDICDYKPSNCQES